MKLTADQTILLHELARLSYGTNYGEGTKGGKGNMGLLRNDDGTVRIVKFNTHGSEETKAQKAVLAAQRANAWSDELNASNLLREQIKILATAVGLGDDVVDRLLNAEGKPLLSRKIVAKIVNEIAVKVENSDINNSFTAKAFWNDTKMSVKTANLKSADDMSFDNVKSNQGEYEKYNRRATDLDPMRKNGYGWCRDGETLEKALFAELIRQGKAQGHHFCLKAVEVLANKIIKGTTLKDKVAASTKNTEKPGNFSDDVKTALDHFFSQEASNPNEVLNLETYLRMTSKSLATSECPKTKMETLNFEEKSSEKTSLYEKTFKLYMQNLKHCSEGKKLIDAICKNTRKKESELDVRDFLRYGQFTQPIHMMRLLVKAGYNEENIEQNKGLTCALQELICDENLEFDNFIENFKKITEKLEMKGDGNTMDNDKLKMALLKYMLPLTNSVDFMKADIMKDKKESDVFCAEESFTYTNESNTYTSETVPYKQILFKHQCQTEKMPDPSKNTYRPGLVNTSVPFGLSVSSLTVTGKDKTRKTLSTVNRFGSMNNMNLVNEGYKTLAVQTFLSNPKLMNKAKADGEIDVPIYRFDMAPENKFFRGDVNEDELVTPVTFKDGDGNEKTVTLVPKVHYVQILVDSYEDLDFDPNIKDKPVFVKPEKGQVILSADRVKALHDTIEKLVNEAKGIHDETIAREVKDLVKQLEAYGKHLKSNYVDKKAGIRHSKTIGHEMFRAGARLALLASKLGHIPSINCNMGRDRTGAMDNEIKMLALQIEEGKELANIIQKNDDKGDQDQELRSELLVKNGENDLARQINLASSPVNTDQSQGIMNFSVLFNKKILNAN